MTSGSGPLRFAVSKDMIQDGGETRLVTELAMQESRQRGRVLSSYYGCLKRAGLWYVKKTVLDPPSTR